jgi:hypothetical protein
MADIKIDIDVLNKRVDESIEDAVTSGMREGGQQAASEAEEVAQQRIRNVGAVFTGDLIESFEIDLKKRGNNIIVTLENTSDHAAPIEYGAEYTDRGPPVAALIPWVKLKMTGYSVPESEVADLPEPQDVEEDTSIPQANGPAVDLTTVFDEEIVQKAFWLQQHIKEEGLDAVRFMKRAEEKVEDDAAETVADAITAELNA